MTGTVDSRGAQLLDEGTKLLAALWDDAAAMVRLAEHPEYHDPRATLAYARVLLRNGDTGRAARGIRSVLEMQERRPQDAHHGNFRWLLEDPCVSDLNGVEFMLDQLIPITREHHASLPAGLVDAMRSAVALGLREIERLDVHPSYTNIALSDIANSVLGGELLADARYVERGARRLDEWLAFTNASGAPHEFNSPTYAAVDITRMAALAERTSDPRVALKARVAEERLWLDVAAHYHPGLAQLAGPHSRSYFDGWSGAGGYLKLMLWRLLGDDALRRETPYAPRSREEDHIGIALTTLHCPDYVQGWLREKRLPFEARETTDAAQRTDITTYMTDSYAIGTASRSYGVGEPPEPWPGFNSVHAYVRMDRAPGYGALYARYVINGRAPGNGAEDHWDEGQHVAAQNRNRAIVAYGLMPRVRPAHSYKLSLRLLGIGDGDEVWAADRRLDAWPAPVAPGERIVIATGDAYVALIPLKPTDLGSDAPTVLDVKDGVLTLDIYNYMGPPKTFWEHRSQSGPFFKGNVRNALVVELADRRAFAAEAFRRDIAGARIDDSVDSELRRTITYESDDGSVALTYSLRDMSLIERRCDGAIYAPPMSASGAADGGGPQFVQNCDRSIVLGSATLASDPGPKWLFVDDTARRYVFVNPSETPVRLRLTARSTAVECNAFGFGRIDLNERAGTVRVETTCEPADFRIQSDRDLDLTVELK